MVHSDGYELVFEDNFSGTELDTEKWAYRHTGPDGCGYQSPSQVSVHDGCLHIKQEYKTGEFGEGWYSGEVNVKNNFLRGYFEIRCICSVHSGDGSCWSAFWLQSPSPYDPEKSKGGIGPGGSEIDIMECFSADNGTCPVVASTIHCSGMKGSPAEKGGLDSFSVSSRKLPDAFEKFHTYALE